MLPESLPYLALSTFGVPVGVFIGALIGLSIMKRRGNEETLFRGSVFATSFLVSMAAWFVAIVLAALVG